jgi:hypothetical protein
MTKKYIDTGYNKSDGDGPGEKELQEIKETYLNDLDLLSQNSQGVKAFDENLNEYDTDFIKNHRFPKLPDTPIENDPNNVDTPSREGWSRILLEKYLNLKNISNDTVPGLWESLEFELSVNKILNIKNCTLPFAGILLGPPGALKTVGIELFRKSRNTFYTDNFSAKSFVSHSTAIKREDLGKIDLLPKIKDKFFLTPELSPTFAKKDEDLIETLGIITRVLDGQGYESDTGAHGHRGYHGEYMFTWVGASVDIPHKVHRYLGTLGPKLYFFRLPLIEKSDGEYISQMINDDFNSKINRVQEELIDYQKWFEFYPEVIVENHLTKVPWDNDKDDEQTNRIILKLGKLLAHLRAVVTTWETDDTQGLDYAYTLAIREDPTRAMTQLRNLARGHALSQGRNYLTLQDMPLLIKVVLSTASLERVRVFELLIEHKGKLTTSMITQSLNTSNNTAKRTMAELIAIGLVTLGEIHVESDNNVTIQKEITLVDKFNWFLTEEFSAVRNLPPYYSNENTLQNCIVQDKGLGGLFSYTAYPTIVLLNSILPRTEVVN